jgi:hypothetical protein
MPLPLLFKDNESYGIAASRPPSLAASRLGGSAESLDTSEKITFAAIRAAGVRGVLIYCSDHCCSHWDAPCRRPLGRGCLDSEDLRRLLLSLRKANLARLLARRPDGIASGWRESEKAKCRQLGCVLTKPQTSAVGG